MAKKSSTATPSFIETATWRESSEIRWITYRKGTLLRYVGDNPDKSLFISKHEYENAIDSIIEIRKRFPNNHLNTNKIYTVQRGSGGMCKIDQADEYYWYDSLLFRKISAKEKREIDKENKRIERTLLYGNVPTKEKVAGHINELQELLKYEHKPQV